MKGVSELVSGVISTRVSKSQTRRHSIQRAATRYLVGILHRHQISFENQGQPTLLLRSSEDKGVVFVVPVPKAEVAD